MNGKLIALYIALFFSCIGFEYCVIIITVFIYNFSTEISLLLFHNIEYELGGTIAEIIGYACFLYATEIMIVDILKEINNIVIIDDWVANKLMIKRDEKTKLYRKFKLTEYLYKSYEDNPGQFIILCIMMILVYLIFFTLKIEVI